MRMECRRYSHVQSARFLESEAGLQPGLTCKLGAHTRWCHHARGGAAIAYTAKLDTGVGIVASFYDAALDQWSLPRQLASDDSVETALSLACSGSKLVVAYLDTQTVRDPMQIEIDGQMQELDDMPQPGETDLCILDHSLGEDLAADSVTVTPANPAPGSSATVQAAISNPGDAAESGVEVAFYDGDPDSGGQIISTQVLSGMLTAGGSANVSTSWTVPSGDQPHQIFAVVDPSMTVDESDWSNNTASVWTVLPDLTIGTCWSDPVSSSTIALTAEIDNTGITDAGGFAVSWRIGSADGQEMARKTVPGLAAGAVYDASVMWQQTMPSLTPVSRNIHSRRP